MSEEGNLSARQKCFVNFGRGGNDVVDWKELHLVLMVTIRTKSSATDKGNGLGYRARRTVSISSSFRLTEEHPAVPLNGICEC